jgi:intracellular sulfur oxidation DsrE/DsrF family protein
MTLNDASYDRMRNWQQGNPYKGQIAALIRDGVKIEECAQTMADNHWLNADLLPGVKVTTSANLRIIELVQQGFVQLQP